MDKSKSSITSGSGGAKQTSSQSKGATARQQRINIQNVQDVLIWLDNNIDDNSADCRNTISQLRRTVNDINMFTDGEECIQFIDNITNNKACMIISGSLGQNIVPRIHNMSQVDSIFIFCGNKKYHEQWAKDWPKIRGVFTEISPICEALKQVAQQCEQKAISNSFVATDGGDISKKNLDHLDPIFMYSHILKEIFLTIKFDDGHIKQFLKHCRDVFADNDGELKNVAKLQTKYHTKTPIWWYTCESFLYPMLNRSLRVMDIDTIIKMGFFITDLQRHIEQIHSEQFSGNDASQIFTVYSGQRMSKTEFDQMTKTQGGLMSFNNFLSTSKDRQVSLGFARCALSDMDMVGIFFVMTIDPAQSTTPFASIVDVGYYGDQDDEVLFSKHTVFRIGDITSMAENSRLFQVNLTLTSDNDQDLRFLTERIREESDPHPKGWYRFGSLLLKMGESTKAQQVYETLLEQTTGRGEKKSIFHMLRSVQDKQGEYQEATTFYEKASEIYQNTLSPADLSLAHCYNNIGAVYDNMGDYSKALSYYEKDLEIRKQSRPVNHPDLGSSYDNTGLVYKNMGDYPKALSSHEKALEIKKQSLPSNHPDLAKPYIVHGLVYNEMGEHLKAIEFYETALEIRKQSLPLNHPDLGASHNNIGLVYDNMGDYPKALSYFEKDLEISKQSLPSNHPDLGGSYNNICGMYENKGDYSKAYSFYERAVKIGQLSLPTNHPDLQGYKRNLDRVKKKL